jgi:hypothetical protein
LKFHQHDSLEGPRLAIPEVRPIVPLFHGVYGRRRQHRVSLYQAHSLDFASLADDRFQDDRSLNPLLAGFGGIDGRLMMQQALLRALGREYDGVLLAWEFGF